MKSIRLALLISAIFTATAHAQAIRLRVEFLSNGDFVSLDQSQGQRNHHVFKGRSGNSFVIDTFLGTEMSGDPSLTSHMDRDGNTLREIKSDGTVVTYAPHNCQRTLGSCSFNKTGPLTRQEYLTRRTQQKSNGFSYTLYDPHWTLVETGAFDLNAHRFAVSGWIKTAKDWDLSADQFNLFSSAN